MKFFMVLAIVAVLGVTGAIKFEFFAGTVSADPPPAVRDAMAIVSAAHGTEGSEAVSGVRAVLDVAGRAPNGVALIRQQLPPLAKQFGRAAPVIHGRLFAVNMKTATGRKCRAATMRLVAFEQWALRTFQEDAALHPAPSAARRFTRRWLALGQWWMARINTCDAGLPPQERAAVAQVMTTL